MTRNTDRDAGKEPYLVGVGEKIRETARAIQVDLRGKPDPLGGTTSVEMWVPKSVIHADSEIYESDVDREGTKGKLIVHRWWAEKNLQRKVAADESDED